MVSTDKNTTYKILKKGLGKESILTYDIIIVALEYQ